jgi:hypothetical protein
MQFGDSDSIEMEFCSKIYNFENYYYKPVINISYSVRRQPIHYVIEESKVVGEKVISLVLNKILHIQKLTLEHVILSEYNT